MQRDHIIRIWLLLYAAAVVSALVTLFPKSDLFHRKKGVKEGALAIVTISGPISTSQSPSAWGPSDADDIARQLHRLSERSDVKAIVLRINSPGGSVGAVQEIYREIERCKSKGQKVVASFADVAASGGYYLAAAADRIVSEPGSITGSIGVIMQIGNLEGLMQKLGIKLEVVKTGAHKDIGSPARPLTPEERRLLQASMEDAYDQFLTAVATGRKMTPAVLKPLADGRIFTGREALKVGLVDELGNRHDAIQVAIRLANLPEKPEIIVESSRGLAGLMKSLSTAWRGPDFSALSDRLGGPLLEYRLR